MCFRVGIIGVGTMGSGHLKNFISGNIPNAKITALCDIDREHLYRFKDELDESVSYFENADDLIASGAVDGVVIATPHYDHPIIAIKAFEAGLHVFCEKPAGVYTKKVREMNEAAEKSGKAFQVNFVMRSTDAFRTIKKMVDGNELGKLKRITWIITDWYRTQSYYDAGGWRATWAGEGGGTLLNQNPHQLDLLQWIAGMPKRLRAFCYFGKNRDIEVEDEATAYMEYDNGMVATYITSVSEFPGTNRLEIVGDRGKLVYEDNKITFYRTTVGEEQFNRETETACGPIPMWKCDIPFSSSDINMCQAKMIENWVDAATLGTPLISPGYEGINSLSVSNAVYLSQWNDGWVEIPFNEDEFLAKLEERIQKSVFKKKPVTNRQIDIGSSYTKG